MTTSPAEGVAPQCEGNVMRVQDGTFRRSSYCSVGACVEVASNADGTVLVRDAKLDDSPVLAFTRAEWTAFVAGVRAGEFDT